jgi:hypothetical protein
MSCHLFLKCNGNLFLFGCGHSSYSAAFYSCPPWISLFLIHFDESLVFLTVHFTIFLFSVSSFPLLHFVWRGFFLLIFFLNPLPLLSSSHLLFSFLLSLSLNFLYSSLALSSPFSFLNHGSQWITIDPIITRRLRFQCTFYVQCTFCDN